MLCVFIFGDFFETNVIRRRLSPCFINISINFSTPTRRSRKRKNDEKVACGSINLEFEQLDPKV